MDEKIFKSILKPQIKANTPKNPKDAANMIADAYNFANMTSFTMFGQKFLKTNNMQWFKYDLEQGFMHNSFIVDKPKSQIDAEKEEVGWKLIARGFYNYWKNASFSEIPPPPGIASATTGVSVEYPGDIKNLAKKLKFAFNEGTVDGFLETLSNILIEFENSITGTYTGTLPNGAVAVLPWSGVFSGIQSQENQEDESLTIKPFGGIGSRIKSIVDFEERHKFDLYETGITVDLNGKVNREFSNYIDDFVGFGIIPEILVGSLGKDLIFSHTHPPTDNIDFVDSISNAFSYPDFLAAIAMESPEIRAVDLLYVHVIQEPKSGWKKFKTVSSIPDFIATNIPAFINTSTIIDIRNTWKNTYKLESKRQYSLSEKRKLIAQYKFAMREDISDFIFNKHNGWDKTSIIHGEATYKACVAVSKKYKIPYQRFSRKLLSEYIN